MSGKENFTYIVADGTTAALSGQTYICLPGGMPHALACGAEPCVEGFNLETISMTHEACPASHPPQGTGPLPQASAVDGLGLVPYEEALESHASVRSPTQRRAGYVCWPSGASVAAPMRRRCGVS
jgi:hypothetical protein